MGGDEEAPRPAEGDAEKSKGRTGGLYMPPAKMKAMMRDMKDTSSKDYQKLSWEALKKSINGLVNKVNVSNIKNIVLEIFGENIIRGRALFVRSLLKAQMASPNFTHIYAALVSVVNTKMPEIGELLLKRVLNQFRRAYKRNDKVVCHAVTRFIAHLVNQQVAHEIVALQLLTLLLEKPTDDSVEVAVGFVQQCGHTLSEVTPQGLNAIFERLRGVLHEGEIDKRVQYMIEGLYAVRKAHFAEHPGVVPELDLVEADDQITHELSLDDEFDLEENLDFFSFDPDFKENEAKFLEVKREILGDDDDDDDEGSDEEDEEEAEGDGIAGFGGSALISDMTEQDLVNLRRTIYLTIMSSAQVDECAHKLMKLQIRPGTRSGVRMPLLARSGPCAPCGPCGRHRPGRGPPRACSGAAPCPPPPPPPGPRGAPAPCGGPKGGLQRRSGACPKSPLSPPLPHRRPRGRDLHDGHRVLRAGAHLPSLLRLSGRALLHDQE